MCVIIYMTKPLLLRRCGRAVTAFICYSLIDRYLYLFERSVEMKHRIITLGRQFGSGGREIAQKLAERLNITCYDRELITLAAKQAELEEEFFAGKDEKAPNPWMYTGVFEGGPYVQRGLAAEDVLFQMGSQIIKNIAEREECIIVGRCADAVLHSMDIELLSVFICAPFDWRVRHRMEINGMDERSAVTLVRQMDKQRKRYYNYYSYRDWGKPDNYDICLNSARLGLDQAVEFLTYRWEELKPEI